MPLYSYKAATADGEVVTGTLDGASRDQVVERLQSLGKIPIRVEQSTAPARPATRRAGLRLRLRGARISGQQIANLTGELAILLHAGLPLDRALGILASLAEGERLGRLLEDVRERVKGGASLTDAMQAQDGVFSRFYINLLRAGENGGALEAVLERLAESLEQSQEIRDSLQSALIYPAILVSVAVLSIFILLGYVVPQFKDLFDGVGQVLPLPTRITIAVGEALQSYGWIGLLLVAGGFWLLRHQLGQAHSRYRWHARFLRLPLAGMLITKIEVARFARTLGTLLQNGVPLLEALSIVKDTIDNRVIADGLERVRNFIPAGTDFGHQSHRPSCLGPPLSF